LDVTQIPDVVYDVFSVIDQAAAGGELNTTSELLSLTGQEAIRANIEIQTFG